MFVSTLFSYFLLLTFEFSYSSDLSLTVNINGKNENILDSLCGRIQRRTMTALIGGSGAGKTSLLNALCGKAHYGKVTGNILINGTQTKIENHKHVMGFVPQVSPRFFYAPCVVITFQSIS